MLNIESDIGTLGTQLQVQCADLKADACCKSTTLVMHMNVRHARVEFLELAHIRVYLA